MAGEGTALIDVLHAYGVEFPCGGKGSCGKCKIRVLEGRIDSASSVDGWHLACQSRLSGDVVLELEQFETLIQADESNFTFTPESGLGIAVDLGTTTVVCQLLDLESGNILGAEAALNSQGRFGSDLITRLEAGLAGHKDMMVQLIRQQIGEMTGRLMAGRDEIVKKVRIMGNSVMQHLFCDLDIRKLSFYPFESDNLEMRTYRASDLNWPIRSDEISFYPSIGSFVGSDILAGILATGMRSTREYTVLIDLGTNGEIVIGNRDRILCASTAAGPAFEGAKISMGMLATSGAISSISAGKKSWDYKVIGNTEARGICGSGLIDAIALLLKEGRLGSFGEILSGETEVKLLGSVVLTQKDIQEFQLAKAAIATGLEILMRRLGIGVGDILRVQVAGGFGSYLNRAHMKDTGMVPFAGECISQWGNTSLMGAKMFLFDSSEPPESILSVCSHVNLESEPGFQDLYIDQMAFQTGRDII